MQRDVHRRAWRSPDAVEDLKPDLNIQEVLAYEILKQIPFHVIRIPDVASRFGQFDQACSSNSSSYRSQRAAIRRAFAYLESNFFGRVLGATRTDEFAFQRRLWSNIPALARNKLIDNLVSPRWFDSASCAQAEILDYMNLQTRAELEALARRPYEEGRRMC